MWILLMVVDVARLSVPFFRVEVSKCSFFQLSDSGRGFQERFIKRIEISPTEMGFAAVPNWNMC